MAADEAPEAADESAPAAPPGPTLAIRAKRVIVRPGEVIENVIVVIEDRRITAVAKDATIPEGAEVLQGDVVCAGFMDPWSIAGIEPRSALSSSSEAFVRAADVVDPYSQDHVLDELVSAGVLFTRSIVGGAASAGGLSVVLRTAGPEPVIDESALSVAVGIGRGGAQFVQRNGQIVMVEQAIDPLDRVGQIDSLVDDIRQGKKYGEDYVEYEQKLAEWEKEIADKEKELEEDFKKAKKARDKKVEEAKEKGEEVKDKSYKESKRPSPPRFDAEKAVFARVVNGEIPLVVSVERALEIRDLLRQTAEFPRLRLVLAGGRSALACASDIAARNIPVIVTPRSADVRGPVGELDPGLALAGELDAAGIEVLIGTGGTSSLASRDLPLLAALAVGHGLDRDAALHAITLGPAKVFDVSRELGTVRRGRPAEVLVLSGDPLSSSTRVLAAISNGEVVHRSDAR